MNKIKYKKGEDPVRRRVAVRLGKLGGKSTDYVFGKDSKTGM